MKTALAASLLLALTSAAGEGYPERPVRILVGYPPGGGTDLVARLIAQPLSERWKQPVVVENRPGANAIIATEAAAKAKPDGYTLLMAYATELAVNPATFKKLPYDPVRDLMPVAQLASAPLVLAVHPSLQAQTVQELIALSKSKPASLSYSSSGNGSVHHFAGELFKLRTGADLLHVPYKGSGPAAADAVSGQVQVTFASVASVLRFVQSGRLRALAVTSRERSAQLPTVPTAIESGLAEVELTSWYGLLAPAATPHELIRKLAADLNGVLAAAEVKKGFEVQGLEVAQSSPAAFAEFIRQEAAKYARIAQAGNIQQE
jgi:tripartite-type tricarboxylate transporter receptor subunit TctC